jgi:hypothetical protein
MLFDLETVFLFIWALGAQPLTGFMLFTFFLFAFLLVLILLYVYQARLLEGVTECDGQGHDSDSLGNARSDAFEYFSTKKDEFVGWARKFSLFHTVRHGLLRDGVHGGEFRLRPTDLARAPALSPRQSDLLMVVGTLTQTGAGASGLRTMCEPKWVMAFGACAAAAVSIRTMPPWQASTRSSVDLRSGCPPGRRLSSTPS